MTRAIVNAYAATFPGTDVSDPWGGGHDTWKVGGKMFAGVGALGYGVDVKCADVESAQLLIEMGRANKAKWMHASWVTVPFDTVPEDELRARIATSYTLIRSKLPKKVQAALGDSAATKNAGQFSIKLGSGALSGMS